MTQGAAGDGPLVVDAVVAKPDVVGPRQLILRHVARQIAALPQRVVDEDRAGERLLTVFFELRAVAGCGGEGQQHLAGGIAAAGGGVVHLLAMALDADCKSAGELCDLLVGQRTVVLQSDAVGAVVEHLSDQRVDGVGVVGCRRVGDLGRRRNQVAPGRTGGGAIGKTLPRERQARGRLDHAHNQRRELAALELIIRMEGAVLVHATHDAPLVEPENIALIGRVIVHVGDAAVRGIADGHGLGVALVVALRAERGGQYTCRLRARRGLRIVAVKLVAEAFLSLEIAHIGLVPSLAGCRHGDRYAALKRVQPRGKGHQLGNGDAPLRRVSAAAHALGQTVFVQRSDGVVIPRRGVHIREAPVVASRARKGGERVRLLRRRRGRGDVRRRHVLRLRGGGEQQGKDAEEKQKPFFHGACSLSRQGTRISISSSVSASL